MKPTIITILLALAAAGAGAQEPEREIKPESIIAMPKITLEEWHKLGLADMDEEPYGEDGPSEAELAELDRKYGDLFIFDDLYSGKCSWYCGGEVKSVTASSCLPPVRPYDYKAENAHDFDHESVWATKGSGVGERLVYTFAGGCPRITMVKILNGHVKSETAWRNNSRVKRLRMYYDGRPYAVLDLEDSRTLQCFDVGTLGPHDSDRPDWTLTFEILDIYPGERFADTVIAELYFDGIDVH